MNILDVIVIIIIVAAIIIETIRGFGKSVFDALAIYGVLWAAAAIAPSFAHVFPIAKDPGVCLSFAYAFTFVLGAIISLILSHYAYNSILLHTGMFDQLLGLIVGIAVGVMISHAITRSVVFSDVSGEKAGEMVATGLISKEMYDFENYHNTIDTITGAATYHKELPNVAGK